MRRKRRLSRTRGEPQREDGTHQRLGPQNETTRKNGSSPRGKVHIVSVENQANRADPVRSQSRNCQTTPNRSALPAGKKVGKKTGKGKARKARDVPHSAPHSDQRPNLTHPGWAKKNCRRDRIRAQQKIHGNSCSMNAVKQGDVAPPSRAQWQGFFFGENRHGGRELARR